MTEYMMIIFAAVFSENLIFSRLIGVRALFGKMDTDAADDAVPYSPVGACVSVAAVTTVSCALTRALRALLVPLGFEYLRTVALVCVILGVSFLWDMLIRRMPARARGLCGRLPILSAGCAVLGAALITWERGYGIAQSVIFGLFASVGFAVAVAVFSAVRERLAYSEPLKYFRGAGISLIAAGLAAMAFAGLAGISLP